MTRNNSEVDGLVREFEKAHLAFVRTEDRHKDVLGYHKMRGEFRTKLQDAVARQHAPPPPEQAPLPFSNSGDDAETVNSVRS
jgi:hypothetical protein